MKGTSHRSKSGFVFDFKPNDFWFTKRKKIYVIALAKPENNKVLIKSIKDIKISNLKILGYDGKVLMD